MPETDILLSMTNVRLKTISDDPNFLATRRRTVPIEIVTLLTAFDAYLGYEKGDGAGGCGGDDPPVGYTQHRVEQHQHQESKTKKYIYK